MNLWLAICFGACVSADTRALEQHSATEFLAILEFLGGIESESEWKALVGTLGEAKVPVVEIPVLGEEDEEEDSEPALEKNDAPVFELVEVKTLDRE